MPTDAWRRTAGGLPLAALGSLGAEYPYPNLHIISTWSYQAIGAEFNGGANSFVSTAYPNANRAIAFPFVLAHPFLVRKVFWFNGTTATTDSADVGVYTEAGARLVSGGGTAISGASSTQEVDVTDTFLQPGRYWLAYAQNGTTATPIMGSIGNALLARAVGVAQHDGAYALPSTLTPAAMTGTGIPLIGIASRTLAS